MKKNIRKWFVASHLAKDGDRIATFWTSQQR